MGDSELQVFSDRLKEIRNKLNLTQVAFAEGIGITASALSAYENNLKNPSLGVVKKIAEKYNISIDWLCGLTNTTSGEDIITYKDVLNLIVQITLSKHKKELCIEFNEQGPYIGIYFHNQEMSDGLSDVKKIFSLFHSESIDKEMYTVLAESILKKYDKEIEDTFPF